MKIKLGLFVFFSFFLAAQEHILPLGDLGDVRYVYDNQRLQKVERLMPDGSVLYTHTYHYNEQNQLTAETLIGDLGEIVYDAEYSVKSPYHHESGIYDSRQNLICHTHDETVRKYDYSPTNELICEDSSEHHEYDRQGNLVQRGDVFYTYDGHRLIKAASPEYEATFAYDEQGNRISKTVNGVTEKYLFSGINELAILNENDQLLQLRIPGLASHPDMVKAIAIETPSAIYAPIHDIQGNIIKLIDIYSREVTSLDLPDPFSRGLSANAPTPWIFSGKHYDHQTGLIYFGHRFYSPNIKKWLTPDPLFQTNDPYQYCLNNPLSYFDPDGKFAFTLPFINLAWGAGLTITSPIWATAGLVTVAGCAVGYAAYKGIEYANDWREARRIQEIHQILGDNGYYLEKNTKQKEGKQRDGVPQRNDDQNKQSNDAKKEIERALGRKLSDKEKERFHRFVSKQGLNYQELVEEGKAIFHGK